MLAHVISKGKNVHTNEEDGNLFYLHPHKMASENKFNDTFSTKETTLLCADA